ncbi:DNA repair protein RadC [Bacillus luteolus]|uniref:DNA repair protein RadC n=1 Tax=Litchfieldia luteola TaxID=682179 RepID=A0ABR9QHA9_9BACI|nr:DNA repair protein RadC [Cytobacillus luteolus]MBE4907878.1 DNA repair protein RadC [Cytobacillus luteolus]MBP1943964.1 DNA repair protein RadC [Cytobacillus luteolus]
MKTYNNGDYLQLSIFETGNDVKKNRAKRVNIVSIKLIKESTLLYKERSIRSPEDGFKILKDFLSEKDREHFIVISLDTKNQPVSINVCHIGSLNASIVHPREVMKSAILSNAASILVGHNHPSGKVDPSREDIEVTKRLLEAGKIIGIEILDHIIVGDGEYVSLKEKGYV